MIRNAELKDLKAINDIYNYEVLNSTATFDTEERSMEKAAAWFNAHNTPHHPIFVCEEEGVIVGYVSLGQYRSLDAFEQTVEISVYVHKDHREHNVGRHLCEFILNYAKNQESISTIVAVITSSNLKSINLFFSLGFCDGGVIKNVGRKFGQTLSIANLYKIIRS